ncbi:hypothetical protein C457_13444 [Haloferax prahovense DSM 18310]|uniref:Uncharacterized protein n=1 Tax=Haloferax prahovense (strain DSM 18310 / JCM 13924 / TL6) TaxID=1227461 RepID=M0G898_HALPT|nr:hypothetical protein [Haloferax prahovense]ELZ67044.1 hypothetical protein C457_13444 [Haloferax prahovense DSM 18310]
MTELVSVNNQKLDTDAIDILRLLHDDGDKTTSEAKSRLHLRDNDYTRRRFEWLQHAGLASLSTEPWSKNETINVKVATLTDEGREFLSSWNFDGLGDGLPVEERVRRLEDRVESLEAENAGLREEMEETNETLESIHRALQGQLDEMNGAVRAICRYFRTEVNVNLNEYRNSDSPSK